MTLPNTISRKLAKPLNTYEGRNVIPDLIGWMLMHPFQMARLYGVPATRMVSQQYGEAKAKTFSRVMSGSVGQKASIKFLADLIPRNEATRQLHEAMDGDQNAEAQVTQTGNWEHFAFGLGMSNDPKYLFLIDIESRCIPVITACQKGHYSELVRLIADDELLRNFAAKADLDACLSNSQMVKALQFKMYLEGQLAFVALLDVLHSQDDLSRYCQLLPSEEWPSQNSAARLFRVILQTSDHLQNASYKELADLLPEFDERTIRRWKLGETMIPAESCFEVSRLLSLELSDSDLFNYWKAAAHINDFWMLIEKAQSAFKLQASEKLKNIHVLPFGYQSVRQWCSERYPFWLNFHRERGMPSEV